MQRYLLRRDGPPSGIHIWLCINGSLIKGCQHRRLYSRARLQEVRPITMQPIPFLSLLSKADAHNRHRWSHTSLDAVHSRPYQSSPATVCDTAFTLDRLFKCIDRSQRTSVVGNRLCKFAKDGFSTEQFRTFSALSVEVSSPAMLLNEIADHSRTAHRSTLTTKHSPS